MRRLKTWLIALLLALAAAGNSYAVTLEEAARRAAKQHDAKVISARTIVQRGRRVHEIKVLKKNGVVKTVRIPE